jgi:hypothetical protein
MNEKIRELYISNGILDCLRDPYDALNNGDNCSSIEVDLQRCAELIVRECIDKIETYQIPVGNSAAGEMACKWTHDALKEIRDDILEHFGVEG